MFSWTARLAPNTYCKAIEAISLGVLLRYWGSTSFFRALWMRIWVWAPLILAWHRFLQSSEPKQIYQNWIRTSPGTLELTQHVTPAPSFVLSPDCRQQRAWHHCWSLFPLNKPLFQAVALYSSELYALPIAPMLDTEANSLTQPVSLSFEEVCLTCSGRFGLWSLIDGWVFTQT